MVYYKHDFLGPLQSFSLELLPPDHLAPRIPILLPSKACVRARVRAWAPV